MGVTRLVTRFICVAGLGLSGILLVSCEDKALAAKSRAQKALIAELDRPGRLVVIIPAAFALGVALGPALAGYMVESHGFPAMLLVCGGISALALLPLLRTEAALRRGAL